MHMMNDWEIRIIKIRVVINMARLHECLLAVSPRVDNPNTQRTTINTVLIDRFV